MQPKNKNTLRDYFTFSARERKAIYWLLAITTIFFLLPHLFPYIRKPQAEIVHDQVALPVKDSAMKRYRGKVAYQFKSKPVHRPFSYKSKDQKNDHFRKDSVARISSFNNYSVDINAASQEEWESLKGIGPVLTSRIIKFREKLGGFISIDQVKETYGLPDSTFQKIRSRLILKAPVITRLNINQLGMEQLASHPYIRYKTAKAIIAYREQHGLYQSTQDLQKIESISSEIYTKIEKYLTID